MHKTLKYCFGICYKDKEIIDLGYDPAVYVSLGQLFHFIEEW